MKMSLGEGWIWKDIEGTYVPGEAWIQGSVKFTVQLCIIREDALREMAEFIASSGRYPTLTR
jgi:hypothetical protein